MAEIGDTLTRKRKQDDGRDTVRLVGFNGSAWIAEALDAFGSPFTISAETLVTEYGSKAPDLPPDERELMRKADAEATARDAHAYGRATARRELGPQHLRKRDGPSAPPPGSPEATFAAAAEEGED